MIPYISCGLGVESKKEEKKNTGKKTNATEHNSPHIFFLPLVLFLTLHCAKFFYGIFVSAAVVVGCRCLLLIFLLLFFFYGRKVTNAPRIAFNWKMSAYEWASTKSEWRAHTTLTVLRRRISRRRGGSFAMHFKDNVCRVQFMS